jgi:hypothetical protein
MRGAHPAGGDLGADLDWVRTDTIVAAFRDRHQEDLVSLIIPSGDFCGLGYENFPVERPTPPLASPWSRAAARWARVPTIASS